MHSPSDVLFFFFFFLIQKRFFQHKFFFDLSLSLVNPSCTFLSDDTRSITCVDLFSYKVQVFLFNLSCNFVHHSPARKTSSHNPSQTCSVQRCKTSNLWVMQNKSPGNLPHFTQILCQCCMDEVWLALPRCELHAVFRGSLMR